MYSFLRGLLLVAFIPSLLFASPIALQKRYDLDDNGTPDLCYVDGTTAHCMLDDGSWVAFPASDSGYRDSTQAVVTTTVAPPLPTGTLPSPAQFALDRGTKWSVAYQGNLAFAGKLGADKLGGDKCRTSKLGDKVIWNCGDMECGGNWEICGFNMGPAFYGTDDVMTVNSVGVNNVQESNFLDPWSGDPAPVAPQNAWGMDTSNVAAINSTHGIVYAWEMWRGAGEGVNRGNAVAMVTLGDNMPIATRMGPLLTGPDAIQMGLLAIISADNYIYTYSIGGPSNIIVGRVAADGTSPFAASEYEFLAQGSSTTWVPGIPEASTTTVGATTDQPGGFGCAVYGSVFFSNYLNQYVILCNIDLSYVNMYTSDTPYGPWSAEYQVMNAATNPEMAGSYGSMAHPEYVESQNYPLESHKSTDTTLLDTRRMGVINRYTFQWAPTAFSTCIR